MAINPTDKSDEFIQSGMTLISQMDSEKYFKMLRKRKASQIPEDRMSRHCGGANGFDDFVEWFIL